MFKQSFKYYKSKNPPPNLDDVLNLNKSEELLAKSLIKPVDVYFNINEGSHYGLRKPNEWEAYEIVSKRGLIFIKNPFLSSGQRYWIKESLKEYSKKPNKLNIDPFNIVPNNTDWWDVSQTDKNILMSLRWATLGYHHNWDSKIYSEQNKSEFPVDLKHMTEYVSSKLGFLNFSAEAAIVNYYHLDSTLSGHTDHSEENIEAPLFSFSFGQSAIFLLGGKTLDEKPTAIFLHSGDIVIMSKDSRLCYHGVPKIMKSNNEMWNGDSDYVLTNEDFSVPKDILWRPFGSYLNHSRININVRQVLDIGQLRLNRDGML
ncbi:nucleic acid dioxygenase ALKBH1 [Diabrotica undecimpunctata]|uniref:nucleic acid dioxygenase ALKBH1 n=1 Tax=Diabrotica undecimpunctata TaxID=50387 RepID=UPI003B6348CD